MNNTEIADIFDRIANLLEIKGEIIFKISPTVGQPRVSVF